MTIVQAQIILNEACIKSRAHNHHREISPEHDAFDATLKMVTAYSKIQALYSFVAGRGITLSNILSSIHLVKSFLIGDVPDSILNEATTYYTIALKEEWPNELQPHSNPMNPSATLKPSTTSSSTVSKLPTLPE